VWQTVCSFTMSCLKMLSFADGELETTMKEALVAYLTYYAGFNPYPANVENMVSS